MKKSKPWLREMRAIRKSKNTPMTMWYHRLQTHLKAFKDAKIIPSMVYDKKKDQSLVQVEVSWRFSVNTEIKFFATAGCTEDACQNLCTAIHVWKLGQLRYEDLTPRT